MLEDIFVRSAMHKPKTLTLQVFSEHHDEPLAHASQVRRALQGRDCMAKSAVGSRGGRESPGTLMAFHLGLATSLSPSKAADVIERLWQAQIWATFCGFSEGTCSMITGLRTIRGGGLLYDLLELLVTNASRDTFRLLAEAGHSVRIGVDVFWKQAGAKVSIEAQHAEGGHWTDIAFCGDVSDRLAQPIIRLTNADFVFLGSCFRAGL
jgi:hypothetical protein